MAQSYYHSRVPSRSTLSSPIKESAFGNLNNDKQFKVDDVQDAYIDKKVRCV